MSFTRTYEDINRRLAAGEAVVFTADQFKALADTEPSDEALARRVDVVTVATYAPMCSSGVFINFGHGAPPIRLETLTLNGVPAYGGVAAVDAYLGATAELPGDPSYGGAHVIEDLVAGRSVLLEAEGKGTDCYPGRRVRTWLSKADLNDFWFFNPRNAYQNYGAAVNSGANRLRTYLGVLEPRGASVSYATAGELSPLLNDPELRSIGIGTPVLLGGAPGYVARAGTQHNPGVKRNPAGLPVNGSRTLALYADAKLASPDQVAAARVDGYGVSIFLGVAFALPVLDAEMARALRIRDRDITVQVKDYGRPERPIVLETNYGALRSGRVELPALWSGEGAAPLSAPTAVSSSLAAARRICADLRGRVLGGTFRLRPFIEALPSAAAVRPLARHTEPAPEAPATSGLPPTLRRGQAGYARALCVDCGACAAHCPSGALGIGAPDWLLHYDDALCTGCGQCQAACLRQALAPVAATTQAAVHGR
ncbi:MAG: hypothetical protein A2087_07915 [Spirochaetes bacterium GWD1_61_31]|nr:MAG: hypothetical protein A2Y37_06155 [Spirochaetes bacterium GWB1_60_80]OHD34986.1 MAG: hypothetical protein A2004_03980 [Spirochaetes bacterium GWC1_61_12]OHD40462.1 MAG: hypothetical protein A2087_07915 [Spirochaetes bacterium GWD1_61_31]OHD43065.1 MAG: hypothetical protein A2Y35_01460 [Spirochaetes bacterium GWE1_60_18]OHD59661.1 MAG: hypothetical protein A2Y32_12335 [Spirochaetes bacterium GWF1_60_12]HAP44113.1 hypothetical protein [Spirochaetaceae bacterium]